MGTYYAESDVGLTGGTGTQEDPYGIETAIAAAVPGDTFYWRAGVSGDALLPGHTLAFNTSGDASAPIHWIGADEGWDPITTAPEAVIDANNGAYHAITVTGTHQIFESIAATNTNGQAGGAYAAWIMSGTRLMLRNCAGSSCGYGLWAASGQVRLLDCAMSAAGVGYVLAGNEIAAIGCTAATVTDFGFRTTVGSTFSHCRVFGAGGSGINLRRDTAGATNVFSVDHCSFYDCADGVFVNASSNTYANVFGVTNCLFVSCSGYAVNVSAPAGQLGDVRNNGSYLCTSGQVPAGRTGLINEGWVALAASPYVDGPGGDLALVRSTTARGAALDGGDLGALQYALVRPRVAISGIGVFGGVI